MIRSRIEALQTIMKEKHIDVWMVCTADYHQSEYVSDYFKMRVFLSGFTGSAGTLIVTQDHAGLWTDGRYFIQAEKQLENSGIELYRMGEEGVEDTLTFIQNRLPVGGTLGFDGRTVSSAYGKQLTAICESKQASMAIEEDIADGLWENRPALPLTKAFVLEEKWCGESCSSKLARVRKYMDEVGANYHVLTTLDDIAWLLNVRGRDINSCPVVVSYCVVGKDGVHWFVDSNKLVDIQEYVNALGICVHDYDEVYDFVKTLDGHVLYDPNKVNLLLGKSIACGIEKENPTVLMKAIKNEIEVENLRKCHIKDGLAVTRFIYWLKKNIGKFEITEITASDYLDERRKEQENYLESGFGVIGAYNANAAMMHYSAQKGSEATLEPHGFYLIDSGGQYYEGTTDITRTVVLGPISDEWKMHYTQVLRGMMNLSRAKFLYGCRGMNLDILAREPLWNIGIDYKCGTGHGVGYLLSVHEAPNGFRWRIVPERNDSCVLEEGMVTTVEPGVYIEGSHGIRIENELVCHKSAKNEYGQFMEFETITMAPIDVDAIDFSLLSKEELTFLNAYHKTVYETLSPLLPKEEADWLYEVTRER